MTESPAAVDLASLQRLSDAGRTAEVFAWDDTTVLKLARDASFERAFEREATALEAASGVPGLAPAFRGEVTVDGRPGLLMERVAGIDLLKELEKKPWRVWRIGRELAVAHAQLHTIEAPPSLFSVHQLLSHRLQSDAVPEEARASALAQLALVPDVRQLCHFDFHPGNLMRTAEGLKVIDFAGSCAGDPDWDHAVTLSLLQLGEPPPATPGYMRLLIRLFRGVLRTSYRRTYRRLRAVDPANERRWEILFLAQRLDDGIPEERERILKRLRA